MQSASFQLTRPKRPLAGWALVLLLHALLFWAVHVGLTRDVVQKMPTVVQALLLSDTRPAPPPSPPPPTPSPPPPTPQPAKPAPTPAPVAPPVTQAPAAELPAISTPTPTPTGLTASAPVATPVMAATNADGQTSTTNNSSSGQISQSQIQPIKPPTKTRPIGILCPRPDYPSASRTLEEEGSVSLEVFIGIDGKVTKITIIKSSGFRRLDDAARNELLRWRFKPATLNGTPVDDSFATSVSFSLDSRSSNSSQSAVKPIC